MRQDSLYWTYLIRFLTRLHLIGSTTITEMKPIDLLFEVKTQ